MLGTLVYDNGGVTYTPVNAQGAWHNNLSSLIGLSATASSASEVDFALTAGVHYPFNATEVRFVLGLLFTNSALDFPRIKVQATDGTTIGAVISVQSVSVAAAGSSVRTRTA